MTYYRIQDYEAEALLDGPQLSYSWNDMGDDERARAGKSVCGSREELAEYLAHVGIPHAIQAWITDMKRAYGDIA